MRLIEFNIVMLGENFPVASINIADFSFRHRVLRENLRLPVVLQAQGDGVALLVVPERMQFAVTEPDNIAIQGEGAQEVAGQFLEYVGRRTVRAVGHNAVFQLDDVALGRSLVDQIVRQDAISAITGAHGRAEADVTIAFDGPGGSRGKAALQNLDGAGLRCAFNFHFEPLGGTDLTVQQAVAQLPESLRRAEELATAFEQLAAQGVAR